MCKSAYGPGHDKDKFSKAPTPTNVSPREGFYLLTTLSKDWSNVSLQHYSMQNTLYHVRYFRPRCVSRGRNAQLFIPKFPTTLWHGSLRLVKVRSQWSWRGNHIDTKDQSAHPWTRHN